MELKKDYLYKFKDGINIGLVIKVRKMGIYPVIVKVLTNKPYTLDYTLDGKFMKGTDDIADLEEEIGHMYDHPEYFL